MSTNPQQPVTLATIAAHLGVSRSTVSNAYNHPDQLSPRLRAKIFETAASLGYNGPDPVARRLRQRHAGAIGVLFSEPLHYAFTDQASVMFLQGVAEAGEQADSGMLLIPARPSEDSAQVVQNAIVDGFILYSIPPGHPFVEAALRRRLPIVCVDQTKIGGVSWIGIDDRAAAQQAADHLLQLGHRKISVLVYGLGAVVNDSNLIVSTQDNDIAPTPSVSWLRLDGYAAAFKNAGLDWTSVNIRECHRNTEDDGANALRTLMERDNKPTALLCTSDALAIGALKEAERLGIKVPEELSIIGFNDLPDAANCTPVKLTTIRQPLKDKGVRAGKLLLEGNAQSQEQFHLEAELIIRESTAPPASSS